MTILEPVELSCPYRPLRAITFRNVGHIATAVIINYYRLQCGIVEENVFLEIGKTPVRNKSLGRVIIAPVSGIYMLSQIDIYVFLKFWLNCIYGFVVTDVLSPIFEPSSRTLCFVIWIMGLNLVTLQSSSRFLVGVAICILSEFMLESELIIFISSKWLIYSQEYFHLFFVFSLNVAIEFFFSC